MKMCSEPLVLSMEVPVCAEMLAELPELVYHLRELRQEGATLQLGNSAIIYFKDGEVKLRSLNPWERPYILDVTSVAAADNFIVRGLHLQTAIFKIATLSESTELTCNSMILSSQAEGGFDVAILRKPPLLQSPKAFIYAAKVIDAHGLTLTVNSNVVRTETIRSGNVYERLPWQWVNVILAVGLLVGLTIDTLCNSSQSHFITAGCMLLLLTVSKFVSSASCAGREDQLAVECQQVTEGRRQCQASLEGMITQTGGKDEDYVGVIDSSVGDSEVSVNVGEDPQVTKGSELPATVQDLRQSGNAGEEGEGREEVMDRESGARQGFDANQSHGFELITQGGLRPVDLLRRNSEASTVGSKDFDTLARSSLHDIHPEPGIFLSHSGAQKAFVHELNMKLQCYPFLDRRPDDVPTDHPALIGQAFKQCKVAVVVLSEEFLTSKWTMLELIGLVSSFKISEMKLLPLFYELSCGDLQDLKKLQSWCKTWEKFGKVEGRVDVDEWREAVRTIRDCNGLEFKEARSEQDYMGRIVSCIRHLLSVDTSEPEGKHKVFISHSTNEREFAQMLGRRLQNVAYHDPFFDRRNDEDEKCLDLIKEAASQCKVAVVILSRQFIESKWPMLELSVFVNSDIKILPVFYGLSPQDLLDGQNIDRWVAIWKTFAEEGRGHFDPEEWREALKTIRHWDALDLSEAGGEVHYIGQVVSCIRHLLPPDSTSDVKSEASPS